MPPLVSAKGGRIDTPTRRLVTKSTARDGAVWFLRVDIYRPGEPIGVPPQATVYVPCKARQAWFGQDKLLQAVLTAVTPSEED